MTDKRVFIATCPYPRGSDAAIMWCRGFNGVRYSRAIKRDGCIGTVEDGLAISCYTEGRNARPVLEVTYDTFSNL